MTESATGNQPLLQYVSPLPDLPTGIAQYSRDLLDAVDGYWPLKVFGEKGSLPRNRRTTSTTSWSRFDPNAPTLFQIGNSEFHEQANKRLQGAAGIVVLHDTVLHHSRFSHFVRSGNPSGYLSEIRAYYGQSGAEVARAFLRGRIPENAGDFPLSEPVIASARAVAVHSQFALQQVEALNPDVPVRLVPMGIPLPQQTTKKHARRLLQIPESAFLIVSVSHINPHKRIPVVLRAIRRLKERVPEVRCIIAGTPAPRLGYERLVAMLGLDSTVQMPGYVADDTARLLVAAADVCVNLRYPSNGETSASLLRMLGAGRPVVVSDGATTEDLPPGVGIKIPVDRFEEEMLTEVYWALHSDDRFRTDAEIVARQYVEESHTIQHMVDGYRTLIERVYGIRLPPLPESPIEESSVVDIRKSGKKLLRRTYIEKNVDSALHDLELAADATLLSAVAEAIVELDLDRLPRRAASGSKDYDQTIPVSLLDRIQCPVCASSLKHASDQLICAGCGSRFSAVNGIPDMTKTIEI